MDKINEQITWLKYIRTFLSDDNDKNDYKRASTFLKNKTNKNETQQLEVLVNKTTLTETIDDDYP